MTSQETKPFDYCPFCGEALGAETFRFCPYCGGQLKGKVNKGKKKHKHNKKPEEALADEVALETVETVETVVLGSSTATRPIKEPSRFSETETVADSNGSAAPEVPAVASAVPRKRQSPRSERHADDSAVQTLILKYCPDKEKLLSKLQMILRRDRFAIKLAVEMTPAVLMYKSKAAELKPVMDACRELGAIYTVVSGDFSLDGAAPAALPESLTSEEQELIRKAPPVLWLGENYQSFAGDITGDGEQGILALSEYHLLFLYREQGKIDLRLTPLKNICSAQIVNCLKNTGLAIREQQKSKEVLYVSGQSEPLLNLQQLLLQKIVPV